MQALEAACWIPILKGKRLVLAGDHKQLAPTVKSRKAEAGFRAPNPEPHNLLGTDGCGCVDGGGGGGGKGGGGGGGGDADGLGLTMFDRVLRDLGHDVCRMLDVQYRMNADICDWASKEVQLQLELLYLVFRRAVRRARGVGVDGWVGE